MEQRFLYLPLDFLICFEWAAGYLVKFLEFHMSAAVLKKLGLI